MRMKDFECIDCGMQVEELVDNEVVNWTCPRCQSSMTSIWLHAPKLSKECIPSYPGCKAQKAGYMHTHGCFPATKTQSGYGGSQSPS
jgi:DNA-directed RNA polymerase subunit RPC12/RpoP